MCVFVFVCVCVCVCVCVGGCVFKTNFKHLLYDTVLKQDHHL